MSCEDCNRPYASGGFPDLIIPFDAWRQISTTGDDCGLLCPSCICQRLHDKGIRCEGAFMSGPIESVSRPLMNALRRVENIELAIRGRDNAWSGVRNLVKILVLSVALGVSIMSLVRIGNVYALNLNPAPDLKSSVVKIDPVKDWPPSRQLALMLVRRTSFVKPVAQRLSRGTVMAQRHDWRWLKANGYIERHDKTGYLVPTGIGGGVADTLAFHHANELRMHVFRPHSEQWHSAGTLCSCGWSAQVDRSSPQLTQSRIYAAQSFHLTAVENGTWKPMAEILDDVLKKVKDG